MKIFKTIYKTSALAIIIISLLAALTIIPIQIAFPLVYWFISIIVLTFITEQLHYWTIDDDHIEGSDYGKEEEW